MEGRPDNSKPGTGPSVVARLGASGSEVSAQVPMTSEPRAGRPDRPGIKAGRDPFLDLVRAVAIVRVVAWHALGWPVLTYLVAAMPATFFVTGSLFARSVGRHGLVVTWRDRARRLIVPLWVFSAIAWIAMAVGAARTDTAWPASRALAWFVPIVDPMGTPWEGGWLSSPLWYLRALVWVFAVAPVLLWLARRRPGLAVASGAVVLVALDRIRYWPLSAGALRQQAIWWSGDLVLYSIFFLMGVLLHDGRLEGARRSRVLLVTAATTVGAVAWRLTQTVPLGVVNNSHPMHLLVGAAWLSLALATRPFLTWLATSSVVQPAVRVLGARSLSIYLWHPAAIMVALRLSDRWGQAGWGWARIVLVVLVAAGTALAVAVFGGVEDRAAGRRPNGSDQDGHVAARSQRTTVSRRRQIARGRFVLASLLVIMVGAYLALVHPDDQVASSALALPRPSQAPPRPVFESGLAIGTEANFGAGTKSATIELDAVALQAIVDHWIEEWSVVGAVVGVATPDGSRWSTAAGVDDKGETRDVSSPLNLMSITKLFTANLVFRAVDAGLIDLDTPLPQLDAVPDFPFTGLVTARQLLAHRSGIPNYRNTPRYENDPADVSGALQALDAVAETGLLGEPGTMANYSSSNYLLLGYLLEQVTGQSFDDLLAAEILQPLGLTETTHLAPDVGEPYFSTSGLLSPVDDVLDAVLALLRDHVGISDGSYAAMTSIDPENAIGAGVLAYCPCTIDDLGNPHYVGVGYAGGSTWVAYLPDYDVGVTIDITGNLWDLNLLGAVISLGVALADAAHAG